MCDIGHHTAPYEPSPSFSRVVFCPIFDHHCRCADIGSINVIEPLREVQIISRRAVSTADVRYLGHIPNQVQDTPIEVFTDVEVEDELLDWQRRGLVELVVRDDGDLAWLPTAEGTLVLGWER